MLKTICITLFIFCSVKSLAQFGPQRIITTEANGTRIICAADVDGDDKIDILSANLFGDNITWYRNLDGQGNFSVQNIIGNLDTIHVSVGDLDGDGDVDVLAISHSDNLVVWYENIDGMGLFSNQKVISYTAQGPYTVIAADLDGDGDMDVITGSDFSGVVWHENTNGKGNFGPPRIINGTSPNSRSVAAVDLDGDGDLDIVVSSSGSVTISWYENLDGLGNFGPQRIIAGSGPTVQPIFCIDIDGDGYIDVIAATPGADKISWYKNLDGMGNFSQEKIISDNLINANTIFSIDLDNDGDNDILAAGGNAFDGEIVWFENLDGLGSFGNKNIISTEVKFPRSVIAADIDNDGDMDVIASSQNDDKIAWYENLTILGMDKNQAPSFLIYPNPVKNILNIETQTARDIKSTTLYDTYGRTLFKIDKGVSQIDFSNYATGIYFLKLSTSKGEQVFKVVRE